MVAGLSKSASSCANVLKAAKTFSRAEILVSSEVGTVGTTRVEVAVLINCGGTALLFWVDLTENLGFLHSWM